MSGHPFRLVLCDVMMADVDGFALARAIAEDGRFADIKVIMLTSMGQAPGRSPARPVGVSASLTKPVKQSDLLDTILTVFASRAPRRPLSRRRRRPASPGEATRRLRILVAEDNATNQKLVVRLLEHRRDTVVVVSNGREAVQRAGEQPFDVILMDVQMPEMSGLEATVAIREREQSTGGHIPIVAMTAHAMTGDRERCLEAGMDRYVSKPLRPDELLAAVDALVASPTLTSNVASGFSRTSPSVETTSRSHLDAPALLADFGGKRALLGEVIDIFLVDGPQMVTAIRQATDNRDAAALAASAHALKGSVGLFVRHGIFETARRLEESGKSGDMTGVEQACAVLEKKMTEVLAALSDLRRQLR